MCSWRAAIFGGLDLSVTDEDLKKAFSPKKAFSKWRELEWLYDISEQVFIFVIITYSSMASFTQY
jgi:hypothetical protein